MYTLFLYTEHISKDKSTSSWQSTDQSVRIEKVRYLLKIDKTVSSVCSYMSITVRKEGREADDC